MSIRILGEKFIKAKVEFDNLLDEIIFPSSCWEVDNNVDGCSKARRREN